MSSDTSSPVTDGGGAGDGEADPASKGSAKGGSFFKELPFLVVIAFLLALLIKAFLVQAFYIPSGSMQQTLELRDRVLVNKLVYDFRHIHRGEVVVFNGLDSFTPENEIAPPANGVQRVLRAVTGAIGVGAPGEKDFIKRVIGIPGDRVACCTNGHVTVQPEGAPAPVELEEPYVFEDDRMVFCAAGTGEAACPPGAEGVLVPEGRLWVMGDHRGSSADSRFHIDDENQGTVPQDKVIGRAFVVVWPLDRVTLLSVPETFDAALGALPAQALTATPYALGVVVALPVVALRRRWRARRSLSSVRLSAKAFVVDDEGRLLLLDCTDPHRPHVRWWELPGGGVEPGEDEVDALRREVLEETGLVVEPAAVGPLQWTQESTFVFRSVRRWSRCHGRVVRLPDPDAAAAPVLTDDEQGSILGLRWWTPQELAASNARFFPRRVPGLLPRLLAGERVDEPFDTWD